MPSNCGLPAQGQWLQQQMWLPRLHHQLVSASAGFCQPGTQSSLRGGLPCMASACAMQMPRGQRHQQNAARGQWPCELYTKGWSIYTMQHRNILLTEVVHTHALAMLHRAQFN